MSLHFILDGYNIIKRTPSLDLPNLKESRENLINIILNTRPQGSLKNKLTIIFDGKPDILHHKSTSGIEVVFSENESADDLIKRIINKSHNQRNICLVTDDKALISSVKYLGIKIFSVLSFLSKMQRPQVKKNDLDEKKGLSYSQTEKINEELYKMWGKEN